MAFVNLSLLIGGAAVAIPVVLHLMMRQKPRTVEFPAVMFLVERKESNRRQLQLRHWILLALRCVAVLLLALALARPSVASALVGSWITIMLLGGLAVLVGIAAAFAWMQSNNRPVAIGISALAGILLLASFVTLIITLTRNPGVRLGDEETPVAAVLLIDTSPRMQYRHHNQTRLQRAKELAGWLLTQLPRESDIAIADTHLGASVFAVDRGAARKTLEGLRIDAGSRSAAEVLSQALDMVATSEKERREVYVFTDRTENAWPQNQQLAKRLEQLGDVTVYVIDVGVEEVKNFGLGEVRLSRQVLPQSGALEISTNLENVGLGGQRVIELEIERYQPELPILVDGEPQLPEVDPAKRRRQTVDLADGGSAAVQFSVAGLEVGTHHGRIKLDRPDALEIDDVRFFTFEVREPWPVLIAHGPGADPDQLAQAIAPYEFRVTGQARFRPTVVPIVQLGSRSLDDYTVVCLLDPAPLPASQWQRLAAYAQDGGNVAIFLGHNATKANFNSPPAQELLPGKLDRQWRSGIRPREFDGRADLYLTPRPIEHEMLAAFRPIAANVPWDTFPVFRHWSFELGRLSSGAATLVPFSNGQPAIVERGMGTGRVLVMTTPISDPSRPAGREAWNWLTTAPDAWPYVMLINETMLYLAGSGDVQLNYLSGQAATIRDASTDGQSYALFTPAGGRPSTVRSDEGRLQLPFTATPGIYRLKPSETNNPRGFSVNLPIEASNLQRVDEERLDAILGEGQYKIASEQEEIVREQGQQRVGSEFFPFLLFLVALMFGLESVLANRFYRNE